MLRALCPQPCAFGWKNPDGWMAAVERLPWFAAEMGCEDVVVAFVEMVGVLSSCSHRGC